MAVSKYSESLSAPDNDNRGTFHINGGRSVELSEGKTVAQIGGEWRFFADLGTPQSVQSNSVTTKVFVRRLVFTSKPIEATGTFQVHVTRRTHMRIRRDILFFPGDKSKLVCRSTDVQQNLAIGFIAYDPARILVIPEDDGIADSYQYSPDIWMLSEDKAYHDGRKEGKHNLCVYKPISNTIGCRVNEKGYLEFIMDGKNHGVVWSKPLPMDRPLWGFVDLPIEYKIQARFTRGLELPPSYHSSVREEDLTPFTSLEVSQEISKLESTMDQKMHHMQQELISSFQRHLRDEFQRNLEDQRRQLDKFQQHTQQELISSFQKQLDGHMKHLEDEFRRNLEDQRRQLEETFEQRMQQELASNLQKHSDALLEMQGQLQSQLAQLESHIQKLKM